MRVCLKLLVLVLCKSVFTQYECNWCSCCKNGRSRCSVQNGLCHDGCIPGFYDPQCRHRCAEGCVICSDKFSCRQCQSNSYSCAVCPTNCLSCDFANRCISCKDGFYNVQHQSGNQNQYSDCSHPCRSTCASCVSLDTCTACVDGKYGIAEYVPNHGTVQDCRFDCKPSCKTCRTFDRCTLCIDGKYKGRYRDDKYSNWYNDCRYYCKPNCKSCTSYSHCSSCIEGKYSGKHKDEPYTQWYDDCRHSCSSNCRSCLSFNQCTSCNDGKYSGQLNDYYLNAEYNDCRHNCKSSCRSCTSFYKCSECVPGKYGEYCERMCGRGCLNSTCDKKTGDCTCVSGFRGNDCNDCAYGHFGIDCDNICKGCFNNHCRRDGKCISGCKPGFREVKCASCEPGKYGEYCNSSCDPKCEQCASKTNCTACKKGYFGVHCQSQCPSHCKICISENACLECNAGFFGNICSGECPRNCKSNLCIQKNGACFSCNLGFYGSHCVSKCPSNCANETCDINGNCKSCKGDFTNIERKCECTTQICLDKSCSRCNDLTYYVEKGGCCECSKTCKNGQCESASKCLRGCENGYHGDDCSLTCKDIEPLCAECSTNLSTTSGVCLKCDVGYYPTEASYRCVTCPQNCANTVCDQANGMCTLGCTDGRWGSKCKRHCPFDCHQCQQTTGKCLTCNGGKFLSNCTEKCSENCNYTREGVGICSIESGACLYGCSSFSKYGTYCANDCNSTCVSKVCDWKTGHCLFGCNLGFYGKSCENQCSKMCSKVETGSRKCNESNGYCFGGCNKGWYGAMCDQQCGVACIKNTCDRKSGNCLYGCSGGNKGPKCLQPLDGSHDAGRKTGVTLGLAVGIVSVVLIIFGIITACYMRKRRNNKAKGRGNIIDENRGGSAAIAFSDLQAREREIEQNDAVYARPSKPKKRDAEESMSTRKTNSDVAAAHVTDCQQEQNDTVYARPNKLKKRGIDESTDNDKTITAAISVTSSETKSDNKHVTFGDHQPKETAADIDTDSGNNNVYDEITLSDAINASEKTPHIKPSTKVNPENTSLKSPASKHSGSRYNTRRSANSVLEIEEDLSNLTAFTRNTTQLKEDAGAYETEGDKTYYNVAAMIKRKVPLDKLAEYVSELTREDFEEEFDKLPPGLIKPYTESQKKENLSKNRYKGIYPYDKTRVILTGVSDYINASFIDGYKKIKAYIASIGPTYKYMEDMSPFWRMVWQEKVGKIVMLTNLSEAGEPKCDQYWPSKDCSDIFKDIQVTSDREEVYADYTIRSFTLQKNFEVRRILHAHFTAWPDKGTPDDVTSLIEFRHKVNSLCTYLDGPVVVHCSAGIGRTGTYISIDSLVQEGQAEDVVDIYACVRNLREHRVNMVQTAGQYQYLNKVLVHILTFDSKPVKASNFHKYMSTHTTEHLGHQFQHLQDSIEARTVDETEAVRLNKRLTEKNRHGADIPGDINRPRLHLQRKNCKAAYINALFINSFRTKKRYIIAQSPLPSTVEDFLTLIVQENVSYIVCMEPSLSGNKAVGAYYPVDNQPLKVGSCTVHSEKAECTDHYVQRTLKILHHGKSRTQEVTVTHIQFTKWTEKQKTPDDPKIFMCFVRDVQLKCDSSDKERPILVHCLTGAEKSGLFCVVSILIEKIQLEQETSVVNTVRQVKNRRHMSIPNKEQYIFCHQCLDEYLHTFDTYSNFSLET